MTIVDIATTTSSELSTKLDYLVIIGIILVAFTLLDFIRRLFSFKGRGVI